MTKPLNLLILDLNQEAGLVHWRKWSNPDRVDWIVAKQTSFTVLHFQSGLGFLWRWRIVPDIYTGFFLPNIICNGSYLFRCSFFSAAVLFWHCNSYSLFTLHFQSVHRHCIVWYARIWRRSFWEFKGLLLSVLVIASYLQRPVLSVYKIRTTPGHRQQVLTWVGAHASVPTFSSESNNVSTMH